MEHQYLSLPESLFETSAVGDFRGEIPLPDITMTPDVYHFARPVRYDLFITNTGGALLVTGTVSAAAETSCARCLDPVTLDMDAEVEAYYLIPGKDEPITEDEEIEYDQLVEGKKIDLTELCQASLALAFPYITLCSDDCKGLCPQCGKNLNHETCDCAVEEADDSTNPFAVLKDLKFD
ncbi:YceD family protein [Anaerotardibacter muris]|uniref:YceD family protein n=1 Tax=Anaerotardibacter muris TaxID=2941505 RepID=UPI00203A5C32|nr:DUF177 domain-containing protein [Anaerotardibacter muris]